MCCARILIVLTVSFVLIVPGCPLWAGEAEGDRDGGEAKPALRKEDEKSVDDERKRDAARNADGERDRDRAEDDELPVAKLGRTVLLRFKMIPEDAPAQRLSVLCVADRYALRTSFTGNQGSMEFHVSGRLARTGDADANKLLLTYDTDLTMAGVEGKFTVGGKGSTEVRIGEETILAELGEKVLCVEVTEPLQNPRPPKPAPPPKTDERKF